MKESWTMLSRSLRRSVTILLFAALLAPVASLAGVQAAQRRAEPAPASAVQHHNPLVHFLLNMLAGMGVDWGVIADGNG
jgi:hypothetical protein